MRLLRPGFLILVAIATFVLLPGGDTSALPGAGGLVTFSVETTIDAMHDISAAPNLPGDTCTSADILIDNSIPILDCSPRVLPAPPGPVPATITAAPIDLGLNLGGPFTDDLDALSFSEDLGTGLLDFDFSVDPAPANGGVTTAAGLSCAIAPSDVTLEAGALEAQGDIFTTGGAAPPGCNVLAIDEASYGLIAPDPMAPGVAPLDNIDALAEAQGAGPCTIDGGTDPSVCAAFSVAVGSAGLPAIAPCGAFADGASILEPPGTPANPLNPCPVAGGGCAAGGPPCVAVPAIALGLIGGDDIDALCWFDLNGNLLPDWPTVLVPGGDFYLFSLTPASTSVVGAPFFSPAALLAKTTPAFADPAVIVPPVSLGLLPTDNVDGAICHSPDTDGDLIPDLIEDLDDDDDGVYDEAEVACESDPFNLANRPERLDGIFAGVSDDGDIAIDEALPVGTAGLDCDGDGWTGSQENLIYSNAPTTASDQDPCGSTGWPADLDPDNRVNIGDINGFTSPARPANDGHGVFNKFGHPLDDTPPFGVSIDAAMARWDLDTPPHTPTTVIDIGDLNAINPGVSAPTARPPMLGGLPAFFTGGGLCPWPP